MEPLTGLGDSPKHHRCNAVVVTWVPVLSGQLLTCLTSCTVATATPYRNAGCILLGANTMTDIGFQGSSFLLFL